MALKQNITFRGITVNDAYIKIDHVFANAQQIRIMYEVFSSDIARQNGESNLFTEYITFEAQQVMDGLNPVEIAYNVMKNLPDFSGSTDC